MKRSVAVLLALLLYRLTMAACAEFIVGTDISVDYIQDFYYIEFAVFFTNDMYIDVSRLIE